MKKRLTAALCAALLLLGLLLPLAGASWDDKVIFTAVNYTVMPLTADAMPELVGGTVYVPYTVFDASLNGGVDVGLFNGGQKRGNGVNTYTIYSRNKNLTFDLNTGLVWDYIDAGTVQENIPRAIIRNGKVYLPAASVCKYFGLGTYYVQNDDTLGYPLFRIKNENEGLDDKTFVSSARAVLLDRLKTFYNSQVSQSAEPSQDLPVPPVSSLPAESGGQDRSGVRTYLAVRCDTGEAGDAVLDALKSEGRSALLLFDPERMKGQDELIRRAVGEGHAVGLLVPGDSLEAAQAAIEEGNRLLERMALTRSRIVLVEEDTAEVTVRLQELGWGCWRSNLNGIPGGRSGLPDQRPHFAPADQNDPHSSPASSIVLRRAAVCSGLISHRGSRMGPTFNPIRFMAALTGMGFTSEKSASMSGSSASGRSACARKVSFSASKASEKTSTGFLRTLIITPKSDPPSVIKLS